MDKNTPKTIMIVPITDEETGEVYLPLERFSSIVDISLVHSYSMEQAPMDRLLDEKSLIIKFYDKDGNQIK